MAKRASASSSSGQPKRPCVAPSDQAWNVSERNLVLGSCSTEEEDAQRVRGEELERGKSHSANCCQRFFNSFGWNGLFLHELLLHFFDVFIFGNSSVGGVEQKEAVELAIIHSSHVKRANANSTSNNDARNLQLQFRTKLSVSIFTGKKLEGKGGTCISVALIDANTRDVITSGPESSIRLDVVVLEGDFNKEDEDNWAQEDFEKYMVKEREGKGPLLTGNLLVTLKGGVGELGELIITDNSSWTRSKRFRVGLKVASGYGENTRIREGKTNAFRVKEHRGELSKKHHPPASDDAVWRLETIAKDGKYHQKLSDVGIDKVEDFLLQLFTDSNKLKEILGKSLTLKNWDILVHHAKTCETNWKLYWYYSDDMRKHGAVFNIDGQLIGVIKDRVYCATHRLSAQEKEHVDAIVKKAFDNWNNVTEFNGETFSGSIPSQVLQIENLTPVQRNSVPATPSGPEAPPENVGFVAEGHDGATASALQVALQVQLQNTDSENAMKLSVDESGHLAAQQPISTDPLNVLIPQGDIHSSSQMHHTGNENAPPEGNHLMGNLQPFVSDDMDYVLAFLSQSPPYDVEFFKTPLYDGGSVSGTSKSVNRLAQDKGSDAVGFLHQKDRHEETWHHGAATGRSRGLI
ncbi:calmodulin-binding protein 60 D [Eucalyptus grandis]|uniref:calmodulin-binding protein 60 D n=1 Tax=Eucalyptus grandis TaxID=71139 RepID=UPI00192E7A27|nr:calmodulin-binding protein 60 D [Eucalyptus grandis]